MGNILRVGDVQSGVRDERVIYLNKEDNGVIGRNRVISAIVGEYYKSNGLLDQVEIAVRNDNGKEKILKSNMNMPYESIIALLYKLRVSGYSLESIKCTSSMSRPYKVVSIQGLGEGNEYIKISSNIDDSIDLHTVIEDSISNLKRKYRVVTLEISNSKIEDNTYSIADIAFDRIFNVVNRIDIECNNRKVYRILSGNNESLVFDMRTGKMCVVCNEECNKIKRFRSELKDILNKNGNSYEVEYNDDILMI